VAVSPLVQADVDAALAEYDLSGTAALVPVRRISWDGYQRVLADRLHDLVVADDASFNEAHDRVVMAMADEREARRT
jgi:hypothetical protein